MQIIRLSRECETIVSGKKNSQPVARPAEPVGIEENENENENENRKIN